MPHRNALEAAQAKIAALEVALEEARGGSSSDDSWRGEVARLEIMLSAAHAERRVAEDRADKAEGELARMRADQARREREASDHDRDARERAAREMGASRPGRDPRTMLTLDQHNRSLPAISLGTGWKPAGVLCPTCAEDGTRVELGRGLVTETAGSATFAHVTCPRCGFTGAKREQ